MFEMGQGQSTEQSRDDFKGEEDLSCQKFQMKF